MKKIYFDNLKNKTDSINFWNWYKSVLFKDCPTMSFWSVLSLNCCCLLKIHKRYIISNCRLVKMKKIPWFLVPHF